AFLIFVARFKDWDAKADTPGIFKEYLIGFSVSFILVLLLFALAIFFKFSYIRRFDKENYPKPPFTPCADYLQYGYKYFREKYSQAILETRKGSSPVDIVASQEFLTLYLRDLSFAIATVDKAALDVSLRPHVAKTLLRAIAAIVEKHPATRPG